MTQTRPKDLSYGRDPVVAVCLVVVLLGAVGFGVWAATAQLAQGITAQGTLIVEDRRRVVQHLEGGIVERIEIQEGDLVRAGDVTLVISDAIATARFSQARVEQARLLAAMDRLTAQIGGAETLAFPLLGQSETMGDTDPATASALRQIEQRLFQDQRAALEGERALVRAAITRLNREAAALEVRRQGKRREIATLADEQSVQAEALNQRMGNISRVNELARMVVIAETELANVDEQESVIARAVKEAELELLQIDLRARATLSERQSQIAAELAVLTEELRALRDRIRRSAVLAPVDGVVIDLAYSAEGAIVGPGEVIFQLVPSAAELEVEVRFSPQDRDDLRLGRAVNLRFGTLDPINPPMITGVLERIGADASYDEQARQFYYGARVILPPDQAQALSAFAVSPGIPVEVFFDKGTPRTPLSYFIEPVMAMIRLGLRS